MIKKLVVIILTLLLCFPAYGCRQDTPTFQSPVQLYYRCVNTDEDLPAKTIAPMIVEGEQFRNDTIALLNYYLALFHNKSTVIDSYDATFPAGTTVLAYHVQDGSAQLHLSENFSELSGVSLTIACACITMTVMELQNVDSVTITVDNATLDGATSITMNSEMLSLMDIYTPEATQSR